MRTFNLVVLAFGLLQCLRYGRGALLFLAPRIRVRGEPAGAPPTAARLRTGEALEALGFEPLGRLVERGPLGALARDADAYASRARRAYADVLPGPAGAPVDVVLVTPFAGGAAVVTGSAPRRAVSAPRVQVGSLPGAPLEALLAAHEVAVDRFARRHGPPQVEPALDARVAAARAWYDGEGRRELRSRNTVPFAITFIGALLVASAVHILLRAPR